MTSSPNGTPVWYELMTPDPAAAQRFYGDVLGWQIGDSGMPGMDYRIAKAGGDMVAGMMAPPPEAPTAWIIYFATPDCDATVKAVMAAGGKTYMAPTDIPGVGRFAALADPQGAAFCVLTGAGEGSSTAFDQRKTGHGNWHELTTSDPKAALAFYGAQFGWTAGTAMDMGAMGTYRIFAHRGADIGGMMALPPGLTMPFWLPYFGADGIDAAIGRITKGGGKVMHGPAEVPGGAWIVQATDPQGAFFALVGPK